MRGLEASAAAERRAGEALAGECAALEAAIKAEQDRTARSREEWWSATCGGCMGWGVGCGLGQCPSFYPLCGVSCRGIPNLQTHNHRHNPITAADERAKAEHEALVAKLNALNKKVSACLRVYVSV